VATWADVWEDLPAEVRLALTPPASPESPGSSSASLFPDEGLPPHEKRILSLLKADESTHIDEIVERPGKPIVVLRNLRQDQADAREEFCKKLLESCQPSALSLTTEMEAVVQDFRKLKVWEKAHTLTLDVYKASRSFPREKIYGLTSQTRRASDAIGANIAEGTCRRADTDFARFLQIAVGSPAKSSITCFSPET